MSEAATFPQIKAAIDATAAAFEEFKKTNDARLAALKAGDEARAAELQARLEELETRAKSPGRTGGPGNEDKGFRLLRTQAGAVLPWLTREQKAFDYHAHQRRADDPDKTEPEFDLGEWARAQIMGSREQKVASGTAVVPVGVSSVVIDKVRALTAVVRAGAGTILIGDNPVNAARITGDPTVYQHTEAAADISESDITLAAVSLNPKLLAVLIPLTVEVVEDSPTLSTVLETALAGAFAAKLDALSIATLLADANMPKSASAHDPAVWASTLTAIGVALAANQDLPTAHISTPANFTARAAQLASTAGSWLGKPPVLAGMVELFTSSMTADMAVFGRFDEGFAVAMRQDLTVEIVRHGKPTSASHLLVAHMRADGVVLQPGRLFQQRKVP